MARRTMTMNTIFDELPTIEETSINGVRTFWIDAAAPFTATLMFRVGIGDERLTERGMTHLVEHLALTPLRDEPLQYNGMVEMDLTTFWAAGSVASVVDFMARLSENLSDLATDRLDVEAGVLIAESLQRGGSAFATILANRFGPHGPGAAAYREYGLRRADGDDVRRWAAERFTADNAVLVLTGAPPADLRLTLPPGDRHEFVLPPDRYPFEPGGRIRIDGQTNGAAIGAFGTRSTALNVAGVTVAKGLEERLRHGLGRVYNVYYEYQRLTADEAYLFWGLDCDADHVVEVTEAVGAVIDHIVDAPTDDELRRVVALFEQIDAFDPMAVGRDVVQRRAQDALRGHPNHDIRTVMARMRSLTPPDIADALTEALRDAMAIIVNGVDIGFEEPVMIQDTMLDGRTMRFGRNGYEYVLGRDGVSAAGNGVRTTVRFDDLQVVEHVAPDRRLLIDERGAWVLLGPAKSRRQRRFIAALDERVPPALVVPASRPT